MVVVPTFPTGIAWVQTGSVVDAVALVAPVALVSLRGHGGGGRAV